MSLDDLFQGAGGSVQPQSQQPRQTAGGLPPLPSLTSLSDRLVRPDPVDYVDVFGKKMPKAEVLRYEHGQDLLNTLDKRGQRGFGEAYFDYSAADTPFVGDVWEVETLLDISKTFKRLHAGEMPGDADLIQAQAYLADMERKESQTWGGMAGDIMRQMPLWMIEFAAYAAAFQSVGGPATLKKAGVLGTKEGLKKVLAAQAGKAAWKTWGAYVGTEAAKGLAAGTAKTAVDTLVVNPLVSKARGQDPFETNISAQRQLEAAASGEHIDVNAARWAGIGDAWVENVSEYSGATIGAVAFANPLAQKAGKLFLQKAASPALKAAFGHEAGNKFMKMLDKSYNFKETREAMQGLQAGLKARPAAEIKKELGRRGLMAMRVADFSLRHNISPDSAWAALKKGGYDGYLEEMAEERLGGFMRGMMGIGANDDAGFRSAVEEMWWANPDQFKAEAVAFAMPMVAVGGLARAQSTLAFGPGGASQISRDVRALAEGIREQEGVAAEKTGAVQREALDAADRLGGSWADATAKHGFLQKIAIGALRTAHAYVTGNPMLLMHDSVEAVMMHHGLPVELIKARKGMQDSWANERRAQYAKEREALDTDEERTAFDEAHTEDMILAETKPLADREFLTQVVASQRKAMQLLGPEMELAATEELEAEDKEATPEAVAARIEDPGFQKRALEPFNASGTHGPLIEILGRGGVLGTPAFKGTAEMFGSLAKAQQDILRRAGVVVMLDGNAMAATEKMSKGFIDLTMHAGDAGLVTLDELREAAADPTSEAARRLMMLKGYSSIRTPSGDAPTQVSPIRAFQRSVEALLKRVDAWQPETFWIAKAPTATSNEGTSELLTVSQNKDGSFQLMGTARSELAGVKLSEEWLTEHDFEPEPAAQSSSPYAKENRRVAIRYGAPVVLTARTAWAGYTLLDKVFKYLGGNMTIKADNPKREQLAKKLLLDMQVPYSTEHGWQFDVEALNDTQHGVSVSVAAGQYSLLEDVSENLFKLDKERGLPGLNDPRVKTYLSNLQARLAKELKRLENSTLLTDEDRQYSKALRDTLSLVLLYKGKAPVEAVVKLALLAFAGHAFTPRAASGLMYAKGIQNRRVRNMIHSTDGAKEFIAAFEEVTGRNFTSFIADSLDQDSLLGVTTMLADTMGTRPKAPAVTVEEEEIVEPVALAAEPVAPAAEPVAPAAEPIAPVVAPEAPAAADMSGNIQSGADGLDEFLAAAPTPAAPAKPTAAEPDKPAKDPTMSLALKPFGIDEETADKHLPIVKTLLKFVGSLFRENLDLHARTEVLKKQGIFASDFDLDKLRALRIEQVQDRLVRQGREPTPETIRQALEIFDTEIEESIGDYFTSQDDAASNLWEHTGWVQILRAMMSFHALEGDEVAHFVLGLQRAIQAHHLDSEEAFNEWVNAWETDQDGNILPGQYVRAVMASFGSTYVSEFRRSFGDLVLDKLQTIELTQKADGMLTVARTTYGFTRNVMALAAQADQRLKRTPTAFSEFITMALLAHRETNAAFATQKGNNLAVPSEMGKGQWRLTPDGAQRYLDMLLIPLFGEKSEMVNMVTTLVKKAKADEEAGRQLTGEQVELFHRMYQLVNLNLPVGATAARRNSEKAGSNHSTQFKVFWDLATTAFLYENGRAYLKSSGVSYEKVMKTGDFVTSFMHSFLESVWKVSGVIRKARGPNGKLVQGIVYRSPLHEAAQALDRGIVRFIGTKIKHNFADSGSDTVTLDDSEVPGSVRIAAMRAMYEDTKGHPDIIYFIPPLGDRGLMYGISFTRAELAGAKSFGEALEIMYATIAEALPLDDIKRVGMFGTSGKRFIKITNKKPDGTVVDLGLPDKFPVFVVTGKVENGKEVEADVADGVFAFFGERAEQLNRSAAVPEGEWTPTHKAHYVLQEFDNSGNRKYREIYKSLLFSGKTAEELPDFLEQVAGAAEAAGFLAFTEGGAAKHSNAINGYDSNGDPVKTTITGGGQTWAGYAVELRREGFYEVANVNSSTIPHDAYISANSVYDFHTQFSAETSAYLQNFTDGVVGALDALTPEILDELVESRVLSAKVLRDAGVKPGSPVLSQAMLPALVAAVRAAVIPMISTYGSVNAPAGGTYDAKRPSEHAVGTPKDIAARTVWHGTPNAELTGFVETPHGIRAAAIQANIGDPTHRYAISIRPEYVTQLPEEVVTGLENVVGASSSEVQAAYAKMKATVTADSIMDFVVAVIEDGVNNNQRSRIHTTLDYISGGPLDQGFTGREGFDDLVYKGKFRRQQLYLSKDGFSINLSGGIMMWDRIPGGHPKHPHLLVSIDGPVTETLDVDGRVVAGPQNFSVLHPFLVWLSGTDYDGDKWYGRAHYKTVDGAIVTEDMVSDPSLDSLSPEDRAETEKRILKQARANRMLDALLERQFTDPIEHSGENVNPIRFDDIVPVGKTKTVKQLAGAKVEALKGASAIEKYVGMMDIPMESTSARDNVVKQLRTIQTMYRALGGTFHIPGALTLPGGETLTASRTKVDDESDRVLAAMWTDLVNTAIDSLKTNTIGYLGVVRSLVPLLGMLSAAQDFSGTTKEEREAKVIAFMSKWVAFANSPLGEKYRELASEWDSKSRRSLQWVKDTRKANKARPSEDRILTNYRGWLDTQLLLFAQENDIGPEAWGSIDFLAELGEAASEISSMEAYLNNWRKLPRNAGGWFAHESARALLAKALTGAHALKLNLKYLKKPPSLMQLSDAMHTNLGRLVFSEKTGLAWMTPAGRKALVNAKGRDVKTKFATGIDLYSMMETVWSMLPVADVASMRKYYVENLKAVDVDERKRELPVSLARLKAISARLLGSVIGANVARAREDRNPLLTYLRLDPSDKTDQPRIVTDYGHRELSASEQNTAHEGFNRLPTDFPDGAVITTSRGSYRVSAEALQPLVLLNTLADHGLRSHLSTHTLLPLVSSEYMKQVDDKRNAWLEKSWDAEGEVAERLSSVHSDEFDAFGFRGLKQLGNALVKPIGLDVAPAKKVVEEKAPAPEPEKPVVKPKKKVVKSLEDIPVPPAATPELPTLVTTTHEEAQKTLTKLEKDVEGTVEVSVVPLSEVPEAQQESLGMSGVIAQAREAGQVTGKEEPRVATRVFKVTLDKYTQYITKESGEAGAGALVGTLQAWKEQGEPFGFRFLLGGIQAIHNKFGTAAKSAAREAPAPEVPAPKKPAAKEAPKPEVKTEVPAKPAEQLDLNISASLVPAKSGAQAVSQTAYRLAEKRYNDSDWKVKGAFVKGYVKLWKNFIVNFDALYKDIDTMAIFRQRDLRALLAAEPKLKEAKHSVLASKLKAMTDHLVPGIPAESGLPGPQKKYVQFYLALSEPYEDPRMPGPKAPAVRAFDLPSDPGTDVAAAATTSFAISPANRFVETFVSPFGAGSSELQSTLARQVRAFTAMKNRVDRGLHPLRHDFGVLFADNEIFKINSRALPKSILPGGEKGTVEMDARERQRLHTVAARWTDEQRKFVDTVLFAMSQLLDQGGTTAESAAELITSKGFILGIDFNDFDTEEKLATVLPEGLAKDLMELREAAEAEAKAAFPKRGESGEFKEGGTIEGVNVEEVRRARETTNQLVLAGMLKHKRERIKDVEENPPPNAQKLLAAMRHEEGVIMDRITELGGELTFKAGEKPTGDREAIFERHGIAATHRQGVKRRAAEQSWVVPYSLLEEAWNRDAEDSPRSILLKANRKEENLTFEHIVTEMHKIFNEAYQEVQATFGDIGIADAPHMMYRGSYSTHHYGLGIPGSVLRDSLDLLENKMEASEAARQKKFEEMLEFAHDKDNLPKPLSKVSEAQFKFMFTLIGLTYPRGTDAKVNIVRDIRAGKYEQEYGLTPDMHYADVVRKIQESLESMYLRRAQKKAAEFHARRLQGGEEPEVDLMDDPRMPDLGVKNMSDFYALMKHIKTAVKSFKGREFSPRTKGRRYDTYDEAYSRRGLLPEGSSIFDVAQRYATDIGTATMHKVVLNRFATATNADGASLVIPVPDMGYDGAGIIENVTWRIKADQLASFLDIEVPSGDAKEAVSIMVRDHVKRFEKGYAEIKSPHLSVERFYALKKQNESLVDMTNGGEAAGLLKQLIGSRFDDAWGLINFLEHTNSWIKMMNVQMSAFFGIAGMESTMALTSGTMLKPANFKKLIAINRMVKASHADTEDLMRLADETGIILANNRDPMGLGLGVIASDSKAAVGFVSEKISPAAGKWLGKLLSLPQMQTDIIFSNIFNTLKIYAMQHYIAQEYSAMKDTGVSGQFDRRAALQKWAHVINVSLGGVNREEFSYLTPRFTQVLNLTMFSWMWSFSVWNQAGGGVLTGPLLKNYQKREDVKYLWTRVLPFMAVQAGFVAPAMLQMMAYLLAGSDDDYGDTPWMWMNEEGRRLMADITPIMRATNPLYGGEPTGKRRVYIRWGKQIYETARWLKNPMGNVTSKASPILRLASELATGETLGYEWDLGFKNQGLAGWFVGKEGNFLGSRFGHITKSFAPFSILSMSTRPDAGLAAWLGPTRKGIAFGSATQGVHDILAAYADEGSYDKIHASKRIKSNLETMAKGLLDAAIKNGYDAEKVLSTARSMVLRDLYAEFYSYLPRDGEADVNDRQMDQLERVARKIMRVNGWVDGIKKSVKGRDKNYGMVGRRSPEQIQAMREAFRPSK